MVDSLIRSVAPYPYPASIGPTAAGQPSDAAAVFFPNAPVAGPEDVSQTNAMQSFVTLAKLFMRPWRTTPRLDKQLRDGQIMFAKRVCVLGGPADNTQEVRNLHQMNDMLREQFKLRHKESIDGQRPSRYNEIKAYPEQAWTERLKARSKNEADKKLFDECWALTTTGILERWNYIGCTYVSPTVASHFPLPPGMLNEQGHSYTQVAIAVSGTCHVLNIFPGAANLHRLFLILRRELLGTDKSGKLEYGSYAWMPYSGIDEVPPEEELWYRDLSDTWQRAFYICLGIVHDQMGVPPEHRKMLVAQGRDGSLSDQYEENNHLSTMKIALLARRRDRDIIFC